MKQILVFITSLFTFIANAEIIVDFEKDPVPVVNMTVFIPRGFEVQNKEDKGSGQLLSEILSSGTKKLDRQAYNDLLTSFGAENSFDVSNDFSSWELSFPYLKEINYQKLIETLKENWNQPRFDSKSFSIAITKLKAAYQGSLDNDSTMLRSTLLRWLNKNELNGLPLFVEDIASISLEKVEKYFVNNIQNTPKIWVGVVAPEETRPLINDILQNVFSKQGKIEDKVLKTSLTASTVPTPQGSKTKTFIILDRKERAQTIMGFFALPKMNIAKDLELPFQFSDYLLVSNGLDAYFASVIRTEKGLAYYANSAGSRYRGNPLMSLISNPQRNKQEEAFKTFNELINGLFEKNQNISLINDNHFDRSFVSFKNSRSLDFSTPSARLSRRQAVVVGSESFEYALSRGNDWKVDRKKIASLANNLWKNSTILFGAVGDSAELKPLAQKYFPEYKVVVIPYLKSISESAYNN